MLAKLLNADATDLWPSTDKPHSRCFGPEIRAVNPRRRAVPRNVWHELFTSADREIDILAYRGRFLI